MNSLWLSNTGAVAKSALLYGGPVYIVRVGCRGSEQTLLDCSHTIIREASTSCYGHAFVSCPYGECYIV